MRYLIFISLLLCGLAMRAQDTNTIVLSDTSGRSWQEDPAFSYMPGLDSLLRIANNKIDSLNRNRRVVVHSDSGSPGGISRFFQNGAVQILFWVLLGLFVVYIVYSVFFRYPAGKSLDNGAAVEVVEDGKLQEESFYQQKILQAESEKDFKSAIRYRFVMMLAHLNGQEKIHFTPEKTNADYISELKADPLLDDFMRVSNIFTYVWYGDRRISEDTYSGIKPLFTKFINSN